MRHKNLLLRFDDKPQAIAILGATGIKPDTVAGNSILIDPPRETAEFEGEVIVLARPLPGYYVSLAWRRKFPHVLTPHLVSEEACQRASVAGFGSGCFEPQHFTAVLRDKDL